MAGRFPCCQGRGTTTRGRTRVMTVDREEIAGLVAHAGDMCLLHRVLAWRDDDIRCSTRSHQHPDNPLRRDGRLSSIHLVEYAAQSMAVHGALLARSRGRRLRPGYLAAIRDVHLAVERIDDLPGDLIICSSRLLDGGPTRVYEFTARNGSRALARGRLTVVSPASLPDEASPT